MFKTFDVNFQLFIRPVFEVLEDFEGEAREEMNYLIHTMDQLKTRKEQGMDESSDQALWMAASNRFHELRKDRTRLFELRSQHRVSDPGLVTLVSYVGMA